MKFEIHESTKGKLVVSDPLAPNGARAGKYFISFPGALSSRLPGSVMLPDEFTRLNNLNINSEVLLSNKFSKTTPILDVLISTTKLKVFHGSFNDESLKLAGLAAKGFNSEKSRALYQESMFEIMQLFLKNDKTKYDYWIVEDCLASGDTLIGVLTLLSKNKSIKNVKIDVVVATTIGINLLIEVAKKLDIFLHINIGFLAYGLSKGTKKGSARLHANYIIYPQKLIDVLLEKTKGQIAKLKSADGETYVVGDMGDAAKSMDQKFDSQYPWNKYRDDNHGNRIAKKRLTIKSINKNKTTMMYFSNGGYLLRSFMKRQKIDASYPEKVISAKRVWSDNKKYGYGVLLDGI